MCGECAKPVSVRPGGLMRCCVCWRLWNCHGAAACWCASHVLACWHSPLQAITFSSASRFKLVRAGREGVHPHATPGCTMAWHASWNACLGCCAAACAGRSCLSPLGGTEAHFHGSFLAGGLVPERHSVFSQLLRQCVRIWASWIWTALPAADNSNTSNLLWPACHPNHGLFAPMTSNYKLALSVSPVAVRLAAGKSELQ